MKKERLIQLINDIFWVVFAIIVGGFGIILLSCFMDKL